MDCITAIDRNKFDDEKEKILADMAKALSHPARIRILKILSTHTGCLNSDLINELGLAQSTVSEHMKILRKARFVIAESKPPRTCFSINKEVMQEYRLMLAYI